MRQFGEPREMKCGWTPNKFEILSKGDDFENAEKIESVTVDRKDEISRLAKGDRQNVAASDRGKEECQVCSLEGFDVNKEGVVCK